MKYRVYHKGLKCHVKHQVFIESGYNNPRFGLLKEGTERLFLLPDGRLCYSDIVTSLLPDPEEYVLEFFTGFKDRHGRDIYEGDLLDFDEEEWEGHLFLKL